MRNRKEGYQGGSRGNDNERRGDLFELVKLLHQSYGINRFFIDEIHCLREFAGYLKRIFDFLPVAIAYEDLQRAIECYS